MPQILRQDNIPKLVVASTTTATLAITSGGIVFSGAVYKITNKIDGKVYIGQTTSCIKRRFREHGRSKFCVKLKRAIDKHGKGNFQIEELVRHESKEELNNAEIFYIAQYNSIKTGYNIRNGGKDGTWNPDSIKKMIKSQLLRAHKIRKPVLQLDLNFNIIKEWESIKSIRRALGSDVTAVLKNKRSVCLGFRWAYKGTDLELMKQKPVRLIQRKNCAIGKFKDGIMITSFPSLRDAAKSLNIHHTGINQSMRGNTLCAGHNWRYL